MHPSDPRFHRYECLELGDDTTSAALKVSTESGNPMWPRRRMNHQEHRANSPSASVVQMETSRFLPWMMLTAILAGVSLALSIMLLTEVLSMKREARFTQLKIDEYRMALLAAGIDPNPHLPGEMR